MSLSAIVPTWNEELWLPRLLERLVHARAISEIVVADHDSVDRTREIADEYGCRIVPGGRPAEGRNRGAAAARGDRLLFVDADVVPTQSALATLGLPSTTGAVHHRVIPITDEPFTRGCYAVADMWFSTAATARLCRGFANFLVVSRDAFEAAGGFDEALDPGEDVDFVRRLSRFTSVRYERRAAVLISPRRFSAELAPWFAAKTFFWEALRLAGIRRNPLPYRWMTYHAAIAAREDTWLMSHPTRL